MKPILSIKRFFRKYILGLESRVYNFGYVRDKVDDRDKTYRLKRPGLAPPSTHRKNIGQFPWRYDQGNIGSCVGHGVCETFKRVLQVRNLQHFDPSRLFAYYIAREDKLADTGASIRDAIKAINKLGICSEQVWPYLPEKYADRPPDVAFTEAEMHQCLCYARVGQTKLDIMDAVSNGYPVVYGKQLYESFMSQEAAKTGIIRKPKRCREEHYGGHCMVIFDYDETGTVELNSWGDAWGQAGVCHVPWEYVLDKRLCSDFWVIYKVES